LNIFGDFFGQRDVRELAEKLNGTQYRESAVSEVLAEVPWKNISSASLETSSPMSV